MKLRILLVFPSNVYKDEIILNFSNDENYEVSECSTIEDALEKLKKGYYDFLLSDMNFSDGTGLDFKKEISKLYSIPTIFVSDESDDMKKILALEYGADDYVVYPFNMLELKARIRAVFRRTKSDLVNDNNKTNIIQIGEFEFNLISRTVKRYGQDIELTGREFELLYALVSNKDKVLSRKELAAKLWEDAQSHIRTVDVHIKRLREKIKDNESLIIRTKWGEGYYFSSNTKV